jgi:hypothetical protein
LPVSASPEQKRNSGVPRLAERPAAGARRGALERPDDRGGRRRRLLEPAERGGFSGGRRGAAGLRRGALATRRLAADRARPGVKVQPVGLADDRVLGDAHPPADLAVE